MRIAVIGLRGFPGIQGGVENHCENIITRLAQNIECKVYRRIPFLTDASTSTPPDGITFIDLPSTRIKGFEALWHTMLSSFHIITHRNADIVNIHNIGPGLFTPLLKLFRYKVVLTYHSPNYEHAKWGLMARTILRVGEYLALRFADRIIFVNKFQMEKFSPSVRSRSVYIPNGINTVSRSEAIDFLQKHNITPGKYLLAVGRLTPEKGFDTLIKAVNLSSEAEQLVIAGSADHDADYLDYLKSLDTNGKVIFTGFTSGEDLRQLYSHAKLYVLSSVNEGFPIVLLEAMSYKLPLIATDIPATHLVNLPDHLYTPVNDPQAMAQLIDKICSQNTLSNGVDYQCISQYTWDNVAATTMKLYQSLHQK